MLALSYAARGLIRCATFVTTLCAAWAVNDALGLPMVRGDERVALSEAPHFYATYAAVVALGIAFLCHGRSLSEPVADSPRGLANENVK